MEAKERGVDEVGAKGGELTVLSVKGSVDGRGKRQRTGEGEGEPCWQCTGGCD